MRFGAGRPAFAAAATVLALAWLAAIGEAQATSANTDVTDLWWDPTDGGWGMELTNTGTFVYGTLFVYGPDRQPTWLAGEMTKVDGELTRFTGPLYVTTGTYYGGISLKPFTAREAGTMSFTLNDVYTGTLRYTVDGVVVNKVVQRQPLTYDDFGGTYRATITATSFGCKSYLLNGNSLDSLSVKIVQNGSHDDPDLDLPRQRQRLHVQRHLHPAGADGQVRRALLVHERRDRHGAADRDDEREEHVQHPSPDQLDHLRLHEQRGDAGDRAAYLAPAVGALAAARSRSLPAPSAVLRIDRAHLR